MDPRSLRQQVLVQEGKRRMEMENMSLIDVSSEDDCLITSPSSSFVFSVPCAVIQSDNLDEDSCFGSLNSKGSNIETSGQSPISGGSSESTKAQKVSRYNLRKSLAWDSAFFTNEGVLNCEELSFVNKTFKRSPLHLPEIEEESQRSSEYGTTVESDSCVLKNLELDLFEQMRISKEECRDGITKASDLPSTVNGRTSDSRFAAKLDVDANSRVTKMPCLKTRIVSKQKPEKCSKESVTCLGESVNTCGEKSLAAIKSTKVLSKGSKPPILAAPNKKSLVTSNTLIKDPQKVLQGKILTVPSHGHRSGDSHSVTPVAKPSPRPSLESPRSGRTLSSHSASSLERSASVSSSSSVDMVKSPRTKSRSRNAALSAYIQSNSKLSPSASPISSIDCMSSDSSSSTCTYGTSQKLKSVSGVSFPHPNGTSGTKISQPIDCVDHDSRGNILLSSAIGSSCSASRKHANFAGKQEDDSTIDYSKPSGLRRPSPKIGFFDVANSPQGQNTSMLPGAPVVHASCKSVETNSGFRSNLPRYAPGLAASDRCMKSKVNKLPDARTVVQNGKPHPGPHFSSSPHLCSSNTRSLVPATRPLSCTRLVESRPSSSKIQKPSSIRSNKKNSQVDALEVVVENLIDLVKHTQVTDLDTKDQGHLADPKQALPEESRLQSAGLQNLGTMKDKDTCDDEASCDDNGQKGLMDLHSVSFSASKVELKPGRSPLAINRPLCNDNRPCDSDLKTTTNTIAATELGQENIIAEDSVEGINITANTGGVQMAAQ